MNFFFFLVLLKKSDNIRAPKEEKNEMFTFEYTKEMSENLQFPTRHPWRTLT
jgi:hypothetical protein